MTTFNLITDEQLYRVTCLYMYMYILYKSWPKDVSKNRILWHICEDTGIFPPIQCSRILSPLLHLICTALRGSRICQGLPAQDTSFKTGHLKGHAYLCICRKTPVLSTVQLGLCSVKPNPVDLHILYALTQQNWTLTH